MKKENFRAERWTERILEQGGPQSGRRSSADLMGMVLFLLAVVMAVCSLNLCASTDIWYDELFTMGFIEQSVGRLLELAARDVHPPLYYLMVKAVVEAVHFFAPGVNFVMIAKAVSVLPYFGLLGYAAALVRKRDGWLCAGLTALRPTATTSRLSQPSACMLRWRFCFCGEKGLSG